MKDFFKPEDFKQFIMMGICQNEIAFYCNEKLNKLIESWPVVYKDCVDGGVQAWHYASFKHEDATHTARLAFIEEIKKEPCKHEPIVTVKFIGNDRHGTHYRNVPELIECIKCGVELEATWSTKGEKL